MMTIWAALVMSQVFFPVIVFFAKPELFRFDLSKPLFGDFVVEIGFLGFISLVNLIVSFTLRKRFTDQADKYGPNCISFKLLLSLGVRCAKSFRYSVYWLPLPLNFSSFLCFRRSELLARCFIFHAAATFTRRVLRDKTAKFFLPRTNLSIHSCIQPAKRRCSFPELKNCRS